MNPALIEKARRETIRWLLLKTVDYSRVRMVKGMNTGAILAIIQGQYPDATELEIRRELDYLEERELVEIKKDPLDNWYVDLKRFGIEVVEYTVPCDPGIARPEIRQV